MRVRWSPLFMLLTCLWYTRKLFPLWAVPRTPLWELPLTPEPLAHCHVALGLPPQPVWLNPPCCSFRAPLFFCCSHSFLWHPSFAQLQSTTSRSTLVISSYAFSKTAKAKYIFLFPSYVFPWLVGIIDTSLMFFYHWQKQAAFHQSSFYHVFQYHHKVLSQLYTVLYLNNFHIQGCPRFSYWQESHYFSSSLLVMSLCSIQFSAVPLCTVFPPLLRILPSLLGLSMIQLVTAALPLSLLGSAFTVSLKRCLDSAPKVNKHQLYHQSINQ